MGYLEVSLPVVSIHLDNCLFMPSFNLWSSNQLFTHEKIFSFFFCIFKKLS